MHEKFIRLQLGRRNSAKRGKTASRSPETRDVWIRAVCEAMAIKKWRRRMTTAKMKREAMQTSPFRYGQAECNARPTAHWVRLKMAKHKTRLFAFFVVRNLTKSLETRCWAMSNLTPFTGAFTVTFTVSATSPQPGRGSPFYSLGRL